MSNTPLHVTRAISNIKGGVDCALGPLTLLVAPNGSGKDRVLNTITVALSKTAYDIAGRHSFSLGAELLTLAPAKAGLQARVELSNGDEASYSIERNEKTGGSKGSEHVAAKVPVLLPVQEVLENLTGSSDKAQTFLLKHANSGVTLQQILDALPENLHKTYLEFRDGAKGALEDGTELDFLTWITEKAKGDALEAGRAVKAAQKILDVQAEGMGAPVAEEEIKKAQADYETAVLENAKFNGSNAPSPEELQRAKQRAASAIERMRVLEGQLVRLREQAKSLPDPSKINRDVERLRSALIQVLRYNASPDAQMELVTQTPLSQFLKDQFEQRANNLEDYGAKEATALNVAERIETFSTDLVNARREAQRLVKAYQEAQGQGSAPEGAQEAAQAVQKAQEHLSTLQSRHARFASVKKARNTVSEAEDRQEAMQKLHKKTKEVVEQMVKSAQDAFVSRVQAYLPEKYVFGMKLREGKRKVCRFGYVRDGHLHSALSGAEWSALVIAVGSTLAEKYEDALVLIIPDERAYDVKNLRAIMEGIRDGAPRAQVILTAPHKPARGKVAGWNIVEIDA